VSSTRASRADIDTIQSLQAGEFAVHDRTHADDTWLLGFDTDTGPASYYAFDRAHRSARFLFHNRPALSGFELAPMEPVTFAARDSLAVHGYATFPPGAGRRDPADGGECPWWSLGQGHVGLRSRSTVARQPRLPVPAGQLPRLDRLRKALPERRRSGVGREDARRPRGRGPVDGWTGFPRTPAGVAIYGGSYGGYAALVGATFTPDIFRCAIDIVGPSNLLTFIDTIPPYWSAYLSVMHRRVGHPEHDRELLIARSPLNAVDRIRIPLLIAQGANDPRVKQAESEQIVAALKAKGIDHEYLLFPDEGHGFAKPENRLTFYRAAERFLARHLGGRNEE